jgi:DHA1 family bicyclomycin/chloramphenicol resistance-like MFS transporter
MLPAQLGIIAFVSSSALALVEFMQLTPTEFSVLFAAVMLGQITGGITGSRLVARPGHGPHGAAGRGACLAAACCSPRLRSPAPRTGARWCCRWSFYLFGCSLMLRARRRRRFSPFPQMAGAASSLLGAVPFGAGAAVSAMLAAAFDGTTRPMALDDLRLWRGGFSRRKALFQENSAWIALIAS